MTRKIRPVNKQKPDLGAFIDVPMGTFPKIVKPPKSKLFIKEKIKQNPPRKHKHKRKNKKYRAKNIQVSKRVQYDAYINSRAWRLFCKMFYATYGKKCVACDSTRNIVVHHMTHERLGRELNEDVAALCFDCHREFHDELKKATGWRLKKVMVMETSDFITRKRELLEFPIII